MEQGWTDFQNEFDIHLGFERQISLKLALDMAGIDFNGRQHDALDDARHKGIKKSACVFMPHHML